MHEASLVQGILNTALESWQDYNNAHPDKPAGKIKEIKCSYGLLACFEPETLRLCFELFRESTAAENAELILIPEALPCHCNDCAADFKLLERRFNCPECKGKNITFTGGNGMALQSIDVESEEI